MIKIFLAIIALIFYESLDLYLKGIFEHPLDFGILKIIFLNTILLMIDRIYKSKYSYENKRSNSSNFKNCSKTDINSSKNPKERLKARNCFSY